MDQTQLTPQQLNDLPEMLKLIEDLLPGSGSYNNWRKPREAAQARLIKMGDPAVPFLRAYLMEREEGMETTVLTVEDAIIGILSGIGSPSAITALVELITTPTLKDATGTLNDWEKRDWRLMQCASGCFSGWDVVGDARLPYILPLLQHQYAYVVEPAIETLKKIGMPSIVAPLLDVLVRPEPTDPRESGKEGETHRKAVRAIATVGNHAIIPVFETFEATTDINVRRNLIHALGWIATNGSRQTLQLIGQEYADFLPIVQLELYLMGEKEEFRMEALQRLDQSQPGLLHLVIKELIGRLEDNLEKIRGPRRLHRPTTHRKGASLGLHIDNEEKEAETRTHRIEKNALYYGFLRKAWDYSASAKTWHPADVAEGWQYIYGDGAVHTCVENLEHEDEMVRYYALKGLSEGVVKGFPRYNVTPKVATSICTGLLHLLETETSEQVRELAQITFMCWEIIDHLNGLHHIDADKRHAAVKQIRDVIHNGGNALYGSSLVLFSGLEDLLKSEKKVSIRKEVKQAIQDLRDLREAEKTDERGRTRDLVKGSEGSL